VFSGYKRNENRILVATAETTFGKKKMLLKKFLLLFQGRLLIRLANTNDKKVPSNTDSAAI